VRLPCVTLLACIAACGPDREEWWDALARVMCDKKFDCEERASQTYWGDEDTCAGEILLLVDTSSYEDCTYDRSSAQECLSVWRRVECEPPGQQYDDVAYWCDQVWTCP
jgi:hypothetical protein